MSTQKTTRILLACANPRGTDNLRLAEEDRTLRESIRLSKHRSQIQIQTLSAATIDDLRRALLDEQFDIVHFSGHGTKKGLVFEDASGRLMVPSSEALAELLLKRGVRTVLLNACYSLSVGSFTSMGSEYTVASSGPISDPGAIEFTRGFYDAIGAGLASDEAFEEGQLATKLKDLRIDSILLRKGEAYTAPETTPIQSDTRSSVSSQATSTLLGVGIDTSGSMSDSIRNFSDRDVSRLEAVRRSIASLGTTIQDRVEKELKGSDVPFSAFVYGFGLRIGDGVADIPSLYNASKDIDLESEIERRRRREEERGRQQSQQYGGLANLARSFGYGDVVDGVVRGAERDAENRVIAEVGDLVLNRAREIGDTPVEGADLNELFSGASNNSTEIFERIAYGATPMRRAAAAIRDRFQRESSTNYDERILLIISDGEPTDGDPTEIFEEVRSSGVLVVSCFVTNSDLANPRLLTGAPSQDWPPGAKLMWDVASEIEEDSHFERYLLSMGWQIDDGAKLFVQANHSEVLEEFLHLVANDFSGDVASLLPQGR